MGRIKNVLMSDGFDGTETTPYRPILTELYRKQHQGAGSSPLYCGQSPSLMSESWKNDDGDCLCK